MKRLMCVLAVALVSGITAPILADTLELADGTLLEGDFVGSSNGIVMFNTGEDIEAFPESEVVGVFFSEGVAAAQAQALSTGPAFITVPAGTRLVIRTTETIDSSRQGAGHRFRGQLEGAVVVDGITAVQRGAFVHGRITQASQAGRVAGSSELAIEFTDIMIDDQLIPISTSGMQARGGPEGARTVGRTARAAALGGLIDGKSGARTGMKVGAGAAILTRGASVNIPRGTLIETNLNAPLQVPL
jgi:hypothetical protein